MVRRRLGEALVGAVAPEPGVLSLCAGDPAVFADVLPVDVVLLWGIFGGGTVIWTRGGGAPDRFGVGVNRVAGQAGGEAPRLPCRLFTFRR